MTACDPCQVFNRTGVWLKRALLTTQELEETRRGFDEATATPSSLAKVASLDSQPEFFEDFCRWQAVSSLGAIAQSPKIARLAASLLGSKTVRLYHDHLLLKAAGNTTRTPWHQDQPYYNVEGRQNLSAWIALDHVEARSSLRLVIGSHHGAWYLPRTFRDNVAKWFPEGSLEEMPDIDSLSSSTLPPESAEPMSVVAYELEAGDAVLFHGLTIHGSEGTDKLRRALSLRYLGDDITFKPRPWVTSPPFAGLEDELEEGSPLDSALFPLVEF